MKSTFKKIALIVALMAGNGFLAVSAKTDSTPEAASQPQIFFFDEDLGGHNRATVMAGIKSFLNAAMRNDRETARAYASQQLYKTAEADRTKLFESFLDLIAEKGSKAHWIFVLQFKDVQFHGRAAFATTLLFIELGADHPNSITLTPRDMIWFFDSEKPQCIVFSHFDTKIKIDPAE